MNDDIDWLDFDLLTCSIPQPLRDTPPRADWTAPVDYECLRRGLTDPGAFAAVHLLLLRSGSPYDPIGPGNLLERKEDLAPEPLNCEVHADGRFFHGGLVVRQLAGGRFEYGWYLSPTPVEFWDTEYRGRGLGVVHKSEPPVILDACPADGELPFSP